MEQAKIVSHFSALLTDFCPPPFFPTLPSYHNRIPENFYKRNALDNWGLKDILAGVAQHCLAYPKTCAIGGNTGTVNSFAGIEVGDISGGLFNAAALTDPEKLGCFSEYFRPFHSLYLRAPSLCYRDDMY